MQRNLVFWGIAMSLKGWVHTKFKFSHHVHMLMESQVKLCSPHNISGSPKQLKQMGNCFKMWKRNKLHLYSSLWNPQDPTLIWKDVISPPRRSGQAHASTQRFWLRMSCKQGLLKKNLAVRASRDFDHARWAVRYNFILHFKTRPHLLQLFQCAWPELQQIFLCMVVAGSRLSFEFWWTFFFNLLNLTREVCDEVKPEMRYGWWLNQSYTQI